MLSRPNALDSSITKMSAIKLTVSSSQPRTSKEITSVSWLCWIELIPSTNATIKKGRRPAKIIRQPRCSAIQPPAEGPTAGATAVTSMPMPIMTPMFLSGACSVMMLNISGRARPVPMPSKMRPSSNNINVGAANPQRMPLI